MAHEGQTIHNPDTGRNHQYTLEKDGSRYVLRFGPDTVFANGKHELKSLYELIGTALLADV